MATLTAKNAALRRFKAFAVVQGTKALGNAKQTVGEGVKLRLTREGIWGSVDSPDGCELTSQAQRMARPERDGSPYSTAGALLDPPAARGRVSTSMLTAPQRKRHRGAKGRRRGGRMRSPPFFQGLTRCGEALGPITGGM